MRFMIGFTHQQAEAYARKHRWRYYHRAGAYTDESGQSVVHVVGDSDKDAERLAGLEVAWKGGIIWGPSHVTPFVRQIALSRARL